MVRCPVVMRAVMVAGLMWNFLAASWMGMRSVMLLPPVLAGAGVVVHDGEVVVEADGGGFAAEDVRDSVAVESERDGGMFARAVVVDEFVELGVDKAVDFDDFVADEYWVVVAHGWFVAVFVWVVNVVPFEGECPASTLNVGGGWADWLSGEVGVGVADGDCGASEDAVGVAAADAGEVGFGESGVVG